MNARLRRGLFLALVHGAAILSTVAAGDVWDAIVYGRYDEVVEAVSSGAFDVDGRHPRMGITPLMLACGHDRLDIARYLLAAGADVNRGRLNVNTGSEDRRPLDYAITMGNIHTLRLLLDAGAEAAYEFRDDFGRAMTDPLHLAFELTYSGRVLISGSYPDYLRSRVLAELVGRLGVPELPERDASRPRARIVHGLLTRNYQESLAALSEMDRLGNNRLFLYYFDDPVAFRAGIEAGLLGTDRAEWVDMALRFGAVRILADLDYRPAEDLRLGGFPLEAIRRAIEWDQPGVARYLVERGLDVNATMTRGSARETARGLAVDKGNEEMIRTLVDLGADLNQSFRGHLGEATPLIAAVRRSRDGERDGRLGLLLDLGADPNAGTDDGPYNYYTPLGVAVIGDKVEAAAALLAAGAEADLPFKRQNREYTPRFWALNESRSEALNLLF